MLEKYGLGGKAVEDHLITQISQDSLIGIFGYVK
jgi:hypothetical protein